MAAVGFATRRRQEVNPTGGVQKERGTDMYHAPYICYFIRQAAPESK